MEVTYTHCAGLDVHNKTVVTGVSSRKMLSAIASGTQEVETLVELAKGSLPRKRTELENVTLGAQVKAITGYAVV